MKEQKEKGEVNNCETKRGMQNCKENVNVNKERKKKKREE